MKACTVVPGQPGSARVDDVAEPPEADGEILVDGMFVGVCGTDVEITRQGYGWPPPGRDRLVLFHESLGRVREAPPDSGFAPGDLVAGVVRRPDPVPCPCCAADEWDFCRNGQYTERGIKQRDGYGSERWRVSPKFAVRLDPVLGDLGVLLEPTSVVAKAWDQIDKISTRSCSHIEHVLITGAGPIGLLGALIAVEKGYSVSVLDQVTDGPKPGLVHDLGGTYLTDLQALPAPPDAVIEATGIGQLVFDVIEHTSPNAIVCLTGISSGTRSVAAELDAVNKDMVLTNEVVFGSVNAGRDNYEQAAAALAKADRDWLARLISRTVPMASWPDALDHQPDDVKVVVSLQD